MWMCLKCVGVQESRPCMDSVPETASFSHSLTFKLFFFLCMNVPHRDGLVKCSEDEVIYTQCFYPPWWKDVLMLLFRLKNSDFNSIFPITFLYIQYLHFLVCNSVYVHNIYGYAVSFSCVRLCWRNRLLPFVERETPRRSFHYRHCSLFKRIRDLL